MRWDSGSRWYAAALVLAVSTVGTVSASDSSQIDRASSASSVWRKASSIGNPSARHESSAAVVGREVFLFGGRGKRPLDVFDVDTGKWRRGTAPPLEIHHAQAAVLDGRIYLIGAMTGDWPREKTVPQVLIYDPSADSWSEGAPLPVDRLRGGAGLVVHDGVFYLIGGNRLGHEAGFVPWLDAFNPATGDWKQLPDAPHARDHFHAAILDAKIYAVGGRLSGHEKGSPLGLQVEPMDVYDLTTGQWSTSPSPLPTPRSGVTVVPFDGKVVVIGGESSSQLSAHARVEAYDPRTASWTRLQDVPVGRHGTQAVVIDNSIHVVAGSRNRGGGPELNDHWVLGIPEGR